MSNPSAFPTNQYANGISPSGFDTGMTLPQYAAIKLKVPNSGDEELDTMIRASLRNDFAAKAMQGICANSDLGGWSPSIIAREAYAVADAMMKAREA
jgi:hypothetical protein